MCSKAPKPSLPKYCCGMRQVRRRFALRAGAISSSDDTPDDLVFGSAWMTHRRAPLLDQERGGDVFKFETTENVYTNSRWPTHAAAHAAAKLDCAGRTGEEVGAVAKVDADALAGAAAGSASPTMPAARTRLRSGDPFSGQIRGGVYQPVRSPWSCPQHFQSEERGGRRQTERGAERPLVLRLPPAHALLDRSVAAPSRVVRIKHEKYGGEPVGVELLWLLLCLSEPAPMQRMGRRHGDESDESGLGHHRHTMRVTRRRLDGTDQWPGRCSEPDQYIIKRRPTSDLELVFKDDAGVTHNYVRTHTSAALTIAFQVMVQYSPPHAERCVQAVPKSRHQRHSQSRAFTIYDIVDISILDLDIPAPAEDNPCFQVTFSQESRTPLLQGHFPHLQCPMAPLSWPLAIASIFRSFSPSCWTWPAPIRLSHLPPPRMSEIPKRTNIHRPTQRTVLLPDAPRARTLSSPAFLHYPTESTPAPPPPPPPQRIIVTSPQVFKPRTPRLPRQQARQSPPIPLSFVMAHVPRSRLPVLARVSKHFSAAAQLVLYRTLELSADDADACVARLAGAPHLAALVTTLTPRAYPSTHSPSFVLALALALRSMRALSALTLPAFDAELLSAAPGTLTHLTLLADTLPYAFFNGFLAAPARAHLTHLALPHFVGVPPAAQDVPSAAVPRLAVLDSSPGLAAALAPGRPLRRVTLHIASTLYDGLRPAALFGALGGALKELVLVLAPDVDTSKYYGTSAK
ncbi:hypothetical protein EDB85DRAFT_2280358 [Lactarius pseudohatsudake]|nr:hypothetical protein EDB85DRAFT_2280358 [Lactarius pseudohatsudake]